MKNLFLMLGLMLSSLAFAQNGQVEIIVDNISNNKGVISIALYDNAKDFTKKEIKSLHIKAKKGQVITTIDDLPPGEYAVAILHDKNENNEMDFNMLGIPKEDYGFSNNAKGVLSAPKFKDAAFKVGSSQTKKLKIRL